MSLFILILLAALLPENATRVHLDADRWVVETGSPSAHSSWWWSNSCAPQKLSNGQPGQCGAIRDFNVQVADVERHPVEKAVVVWATEAMLRDLPDSRLPTATTDEKGNASVALPKDQDVWIRVAGPTLGTFWRRVGPPLRTLRLEAVPAAPLRVSLRGEDGASVSRGHIVLLPASCATICPERLMALDSGSAEMTLSAIAGASYRLVAWSDSHAPATRNVSLSAASELIVPLARGAAVEARIVDRDGKSLDGATLTVQLRLPMLGEGLLRTATTSSGGKVTIAGLPTATVEWAAVSNGFGRRVAQVPLQAGLVDLGDIILQPARRASVRVLTDSRVAVAGAKVVARGSSVVVTDAKGVATIAELPPGDVDLDITAEGYLPSSAVLGRADTDLQVRLERGAAIRAALICEADGRPPHQVSVRITSNGTESRRTVESSNDFVISGLRTGSARIRVFAEGAEPFDSGNLTVTAGEVTDLGMVVLKSGAAIRGIVADTAQAAVRDARVRVLRINGDAPSLAHILGNWTEVVTGEDGSFRVSGLTPGSQFVTIEAPGFARQAFSNLEIDAKQRELDLGTVELSRGTHVNLVCRPATRCGTEASVLPAGPEFPFLAIDSTLESGRGEFDAVPPGKVTLRLTRAKHIVHEETIEVRSSGDTVVEIDLPSLRLRGEVLLGSERAREGTLLFTRGVRDAGVPILTRTQTAQGSTIGMDWLGSFGASFQAAVTPRGTFEVEAIEPGEYDIVFSAGGASTSPLHVRLPDTGEHSLPLRFEDRELAGLVEDANHRPSAARVEVVDGAGATHAGSSGPDGQFRILGVSAGRATVRATASGREGKVVIDPSQSEARRLLLRLTEEQGGGIELTVEGERGQPAAGALVFVSDRGGLRMASTDREGRAVFRSLAEDDSFAVAVHRLGGEWAFATVRAGTPARVVLPIRFGTVLAETLGMSGATQITTPSGFPLDRVLPMVGISPRLTEGASLRLSGLPVGNYAISMGMLQQSATVLAGETTTVRFDAQ